MDNPGTQRTGAAGADERRTDERMNDLAADGGGSRLGARLTRAIADDQTRNDLLMLCRDYADYVNHPERFTADQARGAVQHIVHVLLAALNR